MGVWDSGLSSLLLFLLAIFSCPSDSKRISDVKTWFVFYGEWAAASDLVGQAHEYDLFVLHTTWAPDLEEHKDLIRRIRLGKDQIENTSDDVLLLGYISIGEDERTSNKAAVQGDGRGPGYWDEDLETTIYTDQGVASYYIDLPPYDGVVERKQKWGGAFVNAGDPAWIDYIIGHEERDQNARPFSAWALLEEIGYDGLFLDTPDTPSPWDGMGWGAKGVKTLLRNLDLTFPNAILMLNGGLFYFVPHFPGQFAANFREHVDIVVMQSNVYDSNYDDFGLPYRESPFLWENRNFIGPKIHAEFGRPDSFTTILALDYAQIPGTFRRDYREAYNEMITENVVKNGRLQVVTDRTLSVLSSAVATELETALVEHSDQSPPVWMSTRVGFGRSTIDWAVPDWAVMGGFDFTESATRPRVGIQQAIPSNAQVTIRWDLAEDQTRPVKYNIYMSTTLPFDFWTATVAFNVDFTTGSEYASPRSFTSEDDACPFEYTLYDLDNQVAHYFAVRAQDSTDVGFEDDNEVILAAIPRDNVNSIFIFVDGGFADWENVGKIKSMEATSCITETSVHDDNVYLYLYYLASSPEVATSAELYLNTDGYSFTGDVQGADYRVIGSSLHKFLRWEPETDWGPETGSWVDVATLMSRRDADGGVELRIPKNELRGTDAVRGRLAWWIETSFAGCEEKGRLPENDELLFNHRYLVAIADTTPPVVQKDDIAIVDTKTDGKLKISWRRAEDMNGPIVYEVRGEDDKLYGTTDTRSFLVQGLLNNREYDFNVTAIDAFDNRAQFSTVTGVASLDTTPPTWTREVGIAEIERGEKDSEVILRWDRAVDVGHPPAFFNIYYSEIRSFGDVVENVIPRAQVLPSDKQERDFMYIFDGSLIPDLGPREALSFRIRAEDKLGNEDDNLVEKRLDCIDCGRWSVGCDDAVCRCDQGFTGTRCDEALIDGVQLFSNPSFEDESSGWKMSSTDSVTFTQARHEVSHGNAAVTLELKQAESYEDGSDVDGFEDVDDVDDGADVDGIFLQPEEEEEAFLGSDGEAVWISSSFQFQASERPSSVAVTFKQRTDAVTGRVVPARDQVDVLTGAGLCWAVLDVVYDDDATVRETLPFSNGSYPFVDRELKVGAPLGRKISKVSFTVEMTPPLYGKLFIDDIRTETFVQYVETVSGNATLPFSLDYPLSFEYLRYPHLHGRSLDSLSDAVLNVGLAASGIGYRVLGRWGTFPSADEHDFVIEGDTSPTTLIVLGLDLQPEELYLAVTRGSGEDWEEKTSHDFLLKVVETTELVTEIFQDGELESDDIDDEDNEEVVNKWIWDYVPLEIRQAEEKAAREAAEEGEDNLPEKLKEVGMWTCVAVGGLLVSIVIVLKARKIINKPPPPPEAKPLPKEKEKKEKAEKVKKNTKTKVKAIALFQDALNEKRERDGEHPRESDDDSSEDEIEAVARKHKHLLMNEGEEDPWDRRVGAKKKKSAIDVKDVPQLQQLLGYKDVAKRLKAKARNEPPPGMIVEPGWMFYENDMEYEPQIQNQKSSADPSTSTRTSSATGSHDAAEVEDVKVENLEEVTEEEPSQADVEWAVNILKKSLSTSSMALGDGSSSPRGSRRDSKAPSRRNSVSLSGSFELESGEKRGNSGGRRGSVGGSPRGPGSRRGSLSLSGSPRRSSKGKEKMEDLPQLVSLGQLLDEEEFYAVRQSPRGEGSSHGSPKLIRRLSNASLLEDLSEGKRGRKGRRNSKTILQVLVSSSEEESSSSEEVVVKKNSKKQKTKKKRKGDVEVKKRRQRKKKKNKKKGVESEDESSDESEEEVMMVVVPKRKGSKTQQRKSSLRKHKSESESESESESSSESESESSSEEGDEPVRKSKSKPKGKAEAGKPVAKENGKRKGKKKERSSSEEDESEEEPPKAKGKAKGRTTKKSGGQEEPRDHGDVAATPALSRIRKKGSDATPGPQVVRRQPQKGKVVAIPTKKASGVMEVEDVEDEVVQETAPAVVKKGVKKGRATVVKKVASPVQHGHGQSPKKAKVARVETQNVSAAEDDSSSWETITGSEEEDDYEYQYV